MEPHLESDVLEGSRKRPSFRIESGSSFSLLGEIDDCRREDLRSNEVCRRAAAHLCRQALEETLDAYRKTRAPGLELASMRAQRAALPTYLNRELAGSVPFTWGALSNACHHHARELDPPRRSSRSGNA